MKKYITSLLVFLVGFTALGQTQKKVKDSLKSNLEIGLMGIWQKGNLEQLSVLSSAKFKIYKESFYSEINSSYNFLLIQGNSPINDFWFNGLYQRQPNRRMYLFFQSVNGFAKTYLIDGSSFNSVGVGVNMIKNSPNKYLQFHLSTGYLYFKFSEEKAHTTLGFGSLIRASLPISEQINLKWELAVFYSSKDHTYAGGNNDLILEMAITKNLFLNLMHRFYYHNKEIPNVSRYTSIMQYGLKFKI